MRLMIPLLAMVAVRPDGGGCNPPVTVVHDAGAHDGRIGVVGHAVGRGVMVDEIGVGTPADGNLEVGTLILAVDGVPLTGPDAFEVLREGARGVPGTEVELTVEGSIGPWTTRLTRARVDDRVVRREARLPTYAELDSALIPLWDCVLRPGGLRPAQIAGEVRRGRMTVTRVEASPEIARCLSEKVESSPGPLDRHGGFVWSTSSHPDAIASGMSVAVLPPGSSR